MRSRAVGWWLGLGLGGVLPAALLAQAIPPTPWPGAGPPSALMLSDAVARAETLEAEARLDELILAIDNEKDIEIVGQILQGEIDKATRAEAAGTAGGSIDSEVLALYGRELFTFELHPRVGYGGMIRPEGIQRVHGPSGALDTYSCAGCHSVGGRDGAGTHAQSSLLGGDGQHLSSVVIRNAPALWGVGLLQALAAEMSADLRAIAAGLVAEAQANGARVEARLHSKGVDFGTLAAEADGALDYAGVRGVAADLVVRPFGWKGNEARLRRQVETASRVHFGLQSSVLEEKVREQPDTTRLGAGHWTDPDQDGHHRELEEGMLTAMAVYLVRLETPVILPPSDPALQARWARGEQQFVALGCAECHRPSLKLHTRQWEEHSDTTDAPPFRVDLFAEGDLPRGDDTVMLFSDLRRHTMGPALADPVDDPDGVPRDVFLTRPLWGLAETAPYLHDGRAPTVDAAIRAHGGEAEASRQAYEAADRDTRADVSVYLMSLTRAPKLRVAR